MPWTLASVALRSAGLVALGLSLSCGAAELSVFSAGAAKAALGEIVETYEKASGDKLRVEYAPVGTLLRRLADGAKPDILIVTADVMGEVERKAWTVPGTTSPIGSVGVGVAVHEQAPAPDISSPQALRQTLLNARSITYIDPEKGTSGKHFAEVLKRLGIVEQMKAKTILGDSGYVVEPVALGRVELGIQQITEILPVKGVKLAGPLPEPLQKITVYTVALAAHAREVPASRNFISFLSGAQAREIFQRKGFALPDAALAAPLSQERIAQLVASPDRSAADQTNDLRRKPAQMLAFIGIRPGMLALDLSAGGGYTTELLARAVGPTGRVYGQSAPPRASDSPPRPAVTPEGNSAPTAAASQSKPLAAAPTVRRTSPQALAERARNPVLANISSVVQSFENPVPPELAAGGLDLVTLMFNYHDLGHLGVDRALMNKAVFAGLKSGGIYLIADHAGRPGTGISESGTLHRIEEAFLRQEVVAAGFKLTAQADFLRNPSDPRDKNTPEPAQPKDEFVLKFVKP